MKKLSIIFGIAMLMLGMFVATAGTSSAARLQGPATDPSPCSICTPPVGKLSVNVRQDSTHISPLPIAGATVEIFNSTSTNVIAKGVTDANGNFGISLKPGNYTLRISAVGFGQENYDASVYSSKGTLVTATLDPTNANPLPCLSCPTPR